MNGSTRTAQVEQAGSDNLLRDRSMLVELAERFAEPVDLVEQIYRSEFTSLESHARIRMYLPLIARRRAHDVLRQRRESLR